MSESSWHACQQQSNFERERPEGWDMKDTGRARDTMYVYYWRTYVLLVFIGTCSVTSARHS